MFNGKEKLEKGVSLWVMCLSLTFVHPLLPFLSDVSLLFACVVMCWPITPPPKCVVVSPFFRGRGEMSVFGLLDSARSILRRLVRPAMATFFQSLHCAEHSILLIRMNTLVETTPFLVSSRIVCYQRPSQRNDRPLLCARGLIAATAAAAALAALDTGALPVADRPARRTLPLRMLGVLAQKAQM